VKVYIRYKESSYEGQDIIFATTNEDRAFTMTDKDRDARYFWDGVDQCLAVYEGEKLIETYQWDPPSNGFVLDVE
jgi:hypothetical protein